MNVRDENIEDLNYEQRLKAAVHYTVMRICREVEENLDVSFSKQVIAAVAEATWKQSEAYSNDLEMFARHGKRSTVSPDDVKLLVRKSPKLLEHISSLHRELQSSRDDTKKKSSKGSKKKSTAASRESFEETDENANVTD